MENPSVDRLKWNWVDPPRLRSEDPNAASAKLNPCLETLCALYLVWQELLFVGEGGRNSSPLMAHSRVTVWKVHFDPWRRGFRSGQSFALPLRGSSLAVWPFQWPLDTVHVSHVLAVADGQETAARSCKCSHLLLFYSYTMLD